MNMNLDNFIFESYSVLPNNKEVHFKYQYKDLKFTEKILLPKEIPPDVNQTLLKITIENLHLILGISYFKTFCPKTIEIPYELTQAQAEFWNTVYTIGLGEFFYKNKIDFRGLINFPNSINTKVSPISETKKNRVLLGIGGGKDSIVAFEMLKEQKKDVTGFILDSQETLPQVQVDVTKIMEIENIVIKRQLDHQLFNLKLGFNGHVPITAIYSFIGLLLAVIYGYSSIIIPNGKSANFGNVNYLGTEINHQWSKSEEFENLFQDYVRTNISPNIKYFSNLRTYSEMEIAKMFSTHKKYFSVFSSCNRNFKINERASKRWCGKCAKCAFVFIILAANLSKEVVIKIFDKNLLEDSELIQMYKDLIGKGTMKPFDCVGTFEESLQALNIIKRNGEFDASKII